MGFKYWSVSECNLDEYLHNILAHIDLGFNEQLTWKEFRGKYPHFAYAWQVRERFSLLQNSLEDIQTLQKLLAVSDLPIKSAHEDITRYEWLRITLDLMLYRISLIRDCFLHLVNTIFEFSLKGRDVNFNSLLELCTVQSSEVAKSLKAIANSGTKLRKERNRLAHEGISRGIVSANTTIFKIAAMMENDKNKNVVVEGKNGFELIAIYKKETHEIRNQLIKTMDNLDIIVNDSLDVLAIHFLSRYKKNKLIFTALINLYKHFSSISFSYRKTAVTCGTIHFKLS